MGGPTCRTTFKRIATAEIVQASEAYENMQSQNTRLLQAVTEKDAAATALAAERLRLSQAHELLAEQLAAAQAEAARLGAEQAEAVAMREAAAREAAKVSADLAAVRALGWLVVC